MATTVAHTASAVGKPMTREEKKVIFASSLGTVFEWYDFYLYGSLAAIIGEAVLLGPRSRLAFIFALLAFAAGFIVRPFGAIFFGRLGDMIGRKYTFLVTILIMGLSTFIVGLLPNYASIGIAAPIILIAPAPAAGPRARRRVRRRGDLRGRALAARQARRVHGLDPDHGDARPVPVADRDPRRPHLDRRGGIRRLGLAHSVPGLVHPARRLASGSGLSMNESPAFQKMKAEGKTSKAPLTESFGQWKNLKIVILALVGLTPGQAVVWYTGQFYALFFLTQRAEGRRRRPPTS